MKSNLSPEILRLFQRLRRKIRLYLAVEGGAILCFHVGVFFWISLVLDRFFEPSVGWRSFFLALTVLFFLWDAWRLIFAPIFKPLSNHALAILLERRFPHVNDALLTLVEPEKDADFFDPTPKPLPLHRPIQISNRFRLTN